MLRPSRLRNCSRTPVSSFERDRIAQPCALTTRVSQTSEKRAPVSTVVTRIGIELGTLELRRAAKDVFFSCMHFALYLLRLDERHVSITITPIREKPSDPKVLHCGWPKVHCVMSHRRRGQAGPLADEDLHRHAIENLNEADPAEFIRQRRIYLA